MRPSLHEVQADFRRFIADGRPGGLPDLICGSVADASRRLAIFRNNSLVAHTTVLGAVYPVVRRIVDARFFAYAVHEFLRTGLPSHPCLSEFGEQFPDFLAQFAPTASLLYLPDVARLEWAISRAAGAVMATTPLQMTALVARAGDPALARLRLDPSVRFIASDYPIDLIWAVNQPDKEPEPIPSDEAVCLEVNPAGAGRLRRLDRANWVFRSACAAGATLGAAVEEALRHDGAFDLAVAIAALFSDRLVVACE